LQIDTFKRFTNQMILKKNPRFIVIHGVGEGKLIQEIRSLINTKEGFGIHDANYSPRGVGASYIEIQLSKATPF
jgi:dsDNA-specific endonuclease/ATPase MutS2